MELKHQLQANYRKHHAKREAACDEVSMVPVKLFNPTGAGTWFLIEQDPQDPDLLFGLGHIHEWEWGYLSLRELEQFQGSFGLGIERDLFYQPVTVQQLKTHLEAGTLQQL